MGIDLRIFQGAVRGEMQRWWINRGRGLLALPLVCFTAYAVLTFHERSHGYFQDNPYRLGFTWAEALIPLSIMVIWTLAALNCRRLIDAFTADHGILDAATYHRAFHRLMYAQGVWLVIVPVVLVFALKCIWLFGMKPYGIIIHSVPGTALACFHDSVELFLPALMMMAWLCGLLVFLPRSPWPVWVILAAMVINYVLISPAWRAGSFNFYYLIGFTDVGPGNPVVQWGWLAGLAFTAVMLLMFRWRRHVAGWCCFGVITMSLAVQPVFPVLIYQQHRTGMVPWSLVATLGINSLSSHPPELIGEVFHRLLAWIPWAGYGLEGLLAMSAWLGVVLVVVYGVALNPRVKCPWNQT